MPALPAAARQKVRIPLVGVENTRQFTSVTTATGIVGIGVVGSMIVGNLTTTGGDQRFINVIFDVVKNTITGNSTVYVYKRPGFATHITPAAGQPGTALRAWASQGSGDKLISAFGGTNSTIYDGTTSLGAITGQAKFIDEADVGGTPTLMITSTDNTLWQYTTGGGLAQVVDVDFPGNAALTITGRMVSMDGYNFVMATNGRIYNSDLNSITAWQSTGFLSAQMYPDFGVGLARYKNQLVAFGKETVEFFHITDNINGSPLARTEQGFIRLGCASQYGYVQMEDTVAWCSATDRGGVSVYMLDGFQPKKISTAAVDSQLAVAGPNTLRINCLKVFGKTLILVHANNLCFCYNIEDDIWCEWNSQVPLWHDITCTIGSAWRVYSISNLGTSGKIFTINPTALTYQDNGAAMTMYIQTSKVDFGSMNRKFFHRLTLVGDVAFTATTTFVAWTDDDYRTVPFFYTMSLANTRPFITRNGTAYRRAFIISDSTNAAIRLEAIEVEYTEGNR
jgi:hypothetical protein